MRPHSARPSSRRPRRALFLGGLIAGMLTGSALASPAAPHPASPQPGDWQLTYRVYIGGVHMLDATAQVGMTQEAYRIGLQARTDGFLGRVAAWKVELASTGGLVQGRPQPALFQSVGAWRNEPRLTTLEYDADGNPRLTLAEPPPEKHREPVPEDLRPGTVDPVSAIVAAVQAVIDGRGCDATVPVYDGRQRYDLTFVPKGREDLLPSDRAAFSGPAEACGFEVKPLAGAWRERDRRGDRDRDGRRDRGRNGDVTLWIAAPAAGAPPVPVRLQGSSPLGTVMVHLAEAAPIAAASAPAPKEQAALAPQR